eukprot:SAG31_NODE_520_length_14616_cov_8.879005_12_plen_61_part_00
MSVRSMKGDVQDMIDGSDCAEIKTGQVVATHTRKQKNIQTSETAAVRTGDAQNAQKRRTC